MMEYDFTTTPIVDIVNNIIIEGVTRNASDIHFDPAENYLKIRMRIDGDLRDFSVIENKYKRNLITRVKLLAGMNITESRLPQDGAIKSNINGKDLDLRVSCLPTSFGEKIVIRILDYSMSFEGIESLGFTKENYEVILNMLANPNGIILVTGATGSGKSTTVYSMLQRLNREETNIITVEDPVEMNIEGINQIQVNPEIGLDFSTVLRSILRQDPNIILIGEIRDSETAKIAIRASITGHLVLSTLHTNNSLTTIERLLDMDVERYLLSSSLKGIISQNLAKKLCKTCAKKRPTTEAEKRIFQKILKLDVPEIYEPVGCPECRNGYKGRIALQEVLLISDEIRDAINEDVPRAELKSMIYQKGVKTLFQDGLIKVIDGVTTIEEVFRIIDAESEDDNDSVFANDKSEIINKINTKRELEREENKTKSYFNNQQTVDKPNIVIKEPPMEKEIQERVPEKEDTIVPTTNNLNKTPATPIVKETNNYNNLTQNLSNPVNNANQDSYTEDLINLINQGFFEE